MSPSVRDDSIVSTVRGSRRCVRPDSLGAKARMSMAEFVRMIICLVPVIMDISSEHGRNPGNTVGACIVKSDSSPRLHDSTLKDFSQASFLKAIVAFLTNDAKLHSPLSPWPFP